MKENEQIDPEVRAVAENFVASATNRRAVAAVRAMLKNGFVTTDDLNEMGYNHPPRAIADVRDYGIPVVTRMTRSPSGKRMAQYVLGDAASIRHGQIGRTNFSKRFREAMIARYGPIDSITNARHDTRLLQIDHRIPYRIAGDEGLATDDLDGFMLLDAKSQRAKSWSCERCENFTNHHDPAICRRCFWAFPEDYDHVAMHQQRRTDIVWEGREAKVHDALLAEARSAGLTIEALLKRLGTAHLKR